MASGSFLSNSSVQTTLYTNIYQNGRSGTTVYMHCDWSVHTGSLSSLGSPYNRTLFIKHVNGTQFAAALIKNNTTWNESSNYSGAFDFAVEVGTTDAGVCSVIPSTSNEGVQSCIWTENVSQLNVDFSASAAPWTNASGATNPVMSPTCFEDTLHFAWNAGTNGNNNAIVSYLLSYRVNYGGEVNVPLGLDLSYDLDTSAFNRGDFIDFHVLAYTQHGDNPWSGWSGLATKNRTPYAPTNATVDKTSCIPGETLRVSFTNNGDPDGNAVAIYIQRTDDHSWVASGNSAANYVDIDTTGFAQGTQLSFEVALVDAFGVKSPASNATATVSFNIAPLAPVINYPVAGETVYNTKPHVLLTVGASNDGPSHMLCVDAKNTLNNGSEFSCGQNNNLASSRKVVYKSASAYGATPTLSAKMNDGYLDSSSVTRAFNIATFSPTDPVISTSGMKIRAVHITDLQTAVNNLRRAYGFSNYAFTACVAGVTSVGNSSLITQLQTALQEVLTRINGWDSLNTNFDISVSWISIVDVNGCVIPLKLRQAIEQLRSTLILV